MRDLWSAIAGLHRDGPESRLLSILHFGVRHDLHEKRTRNP